MTERDCETENDNLADQSVGWLTAEGFYGREIGRSALESLKYPKYRIRTRYFTLLMVQSFPTLDSGREICHGRELFRPGITS